LKRPVTRRTKHLSKLKKVPKTGQPTKVHPSNGQKGSKVQEQKKKQYHTQDGRPILHSGRKNVKKGETDGANQKQTPTHAIAHGVTAPRERKGRGLLLKYPLNRVRNEGQEQWGGRERQRLTNDRREKYEIIVELEIDQGNARKRNWLWGPKDGDGREPLAGQSPLKKPEKEGK